MINPSTPADSDARPDTLSPARALYAEQIVLLDDMAAEARDIARALARRAAAVDAAAEAEDGLSDGAAVAILERISRAHGRASRAVRLTLMLQARLMQDLEAWDHRAARGAAWAVTEQRLEQEELAEARRAQVERIVERVAERGDRNAHEVERLVEEASDRLDCEDVHGDILSRPVSEWVDLICRDLDLDPDWPRLSEEAWAREEQASPAGAGGPLAGLAAMAERSPDSNRLRLHKASP